MSTITLKIDTEHLDHQAIHEIQSILFRSVQPAIDEREGFTGLYPLDIVGRGAVFGIDNKPTARFGFDKNKPKL